MTGVSGRDQELFCGHDLSIDCLFLQEITSRKTSFLFLMCKDGKEMMIKREGDFKKLNNANTA